MSYRTHGAPPPIGEALGKSYEIYKNNFGPILVGCLCSMLCSFVPLVGQLLALPGMFYVGLKAVRGEKIEPADGFIAFKKAGDHIILGLLKMSGILLCFIGVWITNPLFNVGTFLILDQNMTWGQAKDVCMKDVKSNLFAWFLFDFVVVFVPVMLGLLLCFVGVFLTVPITGIAMAYAYEKSLKVPENSELVS